MDDRQVTRHVCTQPRPSYALHQRVGVAMGDREEVERILSYFS